MHAQTMETESHHGKPCQALTKRGAPCPWPADGEGSYCWRHDPARAEERKQRLRELGAKGVKARAENREEVRSLSLATLEKIREVLERALERVETSGADAATKAHATARICSVAMQRLGKARA